MRHCTYVLVLLGCLLAVAPLEFLLGCRVLRRPGRLLAALVPEFVLFGGWDSYAIHAGHWSYDRGHTLGVTLPGGMPVEEGLFFIVVPLCAVLTFEAVQRVFRRPQPQPATAQRQATR